jgi:hypothetical protein
MRARLLYLAAACLLPGCQAAFTDRHHFATVNPATNEIINIFRVTVRGSAQMANARYISGYYDQRAVDLFFNETRSTDLTGNLSARGGEPIFRVANCAGMTDVQCTAAQDRELRMVPIGSDAGRQGAFVLILSTSADAVAGTIGAFAENETVMQSAMYLATRSTREQAAAISARSGILGNTRQAAISELDALFTAAGTAANDADRTRAYLEILRAAAAGLEPSAAPSFQTVQEARAWFAARPRSGAN